MKKNEATKSRLVKKELTFTLTEAEANKKLETSDRLERAIDKIKADIKAYADSQKLFMKDLVKERTSIRKQIETNSEVRLVDCREVLNFETETVSWQFKGKTMDERKMYESEKQEQLPFPKSKTPRTSRTRVVTSPASKTTVKLSQPEQVIA